MPTPAGGTTAYATGSDFAARFDVRSIGDRLADLGVRVANIQNDPNLAKLLQVASGMVEAALLRGQKYQVADLQALTGNSLEYLKDLVCALALWRVFSRRPALAQALPEVCKMALADLEALGQGARIFSLQEKMSAGYRSPIYGPQAPATVKPLPVSQQAGSLFGDAV